MGWNRKVSITMNSYPFHQLFPYAQMRVKNWEPKILFKNYSKKIDKAMIIIKTT